jgi:hypothetical protein
MLHRVVRNRFELSVSPPAGSVFTGGDDGILAGSEQAQSLQAWAKRLAFHSGADLASIWPLRDLPVEVPEKLITIGLCRLERNSPRC